MALCIGTIAVGALVKGSLLLVRETRIAVKVMEERAVQVQIRFAILKEDEGLKELDT